MTGGKANSAERDNRRRVPLGGRGLALLKPAGDDVRMESAFARAAWRVLEPIHAVTYFAPECVQANRDVGLRGFWMGYFGARAAPLGPVPAGVVEATFYNFRPSLVRRAIPDAWTFAEPNAIVEARTASAAHVLRTLVPEVETVAAELNPVLSAVVGAADGSGRPLFSANRDLAEPEDPVGRLWQAATTLREHRGDGHVALLAGEGLDGCEVHVLATRVADTSPELFRQSRGWTPEEWKAAVQRLDERDLTERRAHDLHAQIEARTDELALPPYRQVDDPDRLIALLTSVARNVVAAGVIPFPNDIGLPRPT